MKKWFAENKKGLILSLAFTFLPTVIGLLLWNRLPDSMTVHWGGDGVADGTGSKAFAVFGLPTIMAALNVLCLLVTAMDPKQGKQNRKAMRLVFWIMPAVSAVCCTVIYAASMGQVIEAGIMMPFLGVMFLIMGNYLPKVKQNSTLGIKISWTLGNEENWNKTHRLAGKIWVVAGGVMILGGLLPLMWMIPVLIGLILLMIAVPMAYSYRIYRAHKAQGVSYEPVCVKDGKGAKWVSIVMLIAVLAFAAVILFTGDITYTCGEEALQIKASFMDDLTVSYTQIDAIELREDFDVGVRNMGFGSARLSMGTFQNDELNQYTIYAYTGCDRMILIRSGERYLAINAQTEAETQTLFETLQQKLGK